MVALRKHFDTRTLERMAFIAVIVLLLIVTYKSQRQQEEDSSKASLLASQVEEQTLRLEQLQDDFFSTRYNLSKLQQGLTVNATLSKDGGNPPATILPLNVSWEVNGSVLRPSEYNAAEIADLQQKIDWLKVSGVTDAEKETYQEEIREFKRLQSELSNGEPKYRLEDITITVSNPRQEPANLSYSFCWVELDCRVVLMKGTVVAGNGTNSYRLPIELPKLLTIEKQKLTLRGSVSEGREELLYGDHIILSPELAR